MGSAVSADDAAIARRLRDCYSGAIYDTIRELGGASSVLPPELALLDPEVPVAGPAFTLLGSTKERLSAHESLSSWTRFLSAAPPDHVVVCQPNDSTLAHIGELSAQTLQRRGSAGFVVDGGARDVDFILRLRFPTCCRYSTPADIVGRWSVDDMACAITIGDVRVDNGDFVVADRDGVIVVPRPMVADVLERAEKLMSTETELRQALREGLDPEAAYQRYGVF
jgi:4-hydroxy-4-methyl-2-oxoglutarate aldolase